MLSVTTMHKTNGANLSLGKKIRIFLAMRVSIKNDILLTEVSVHQLRDSFVPAGTRSFCTPGTW